MHGIDLRTAQVKKTGIENPLVLADEQRKFFGDLSEKVCSPSWTTK